MIWSPTHKNPAAEEWVTEVKNQNPANQWVEDVRQTVNAAAGSVIPIEVNVSGGNQRYPTLNFIYQSNII